MYDYGSQQAADEFLSASAGFLACYFFFILAIVAFMIWVWWKILTKAGYSGALAFLNLIPLGTFVLMMILAFGEWPVLRQLRAGGTGTYLPTPTAPAYQQPPAYQPPTYQPPAPPMAQEPAPPMAQEPAPPTYQPPVAPMPPEPAPPVYPPPASEEPPVDEPPA